MLFGFITTGGMNTGLVYPGRGLCVCDYMMIQGSMPPPCSIIPGMHMWTREDVKQSTHETILFIDTFITDERMLTVTVILPTFHTTHACMHFYIECDDFNHIH